MGNFDYIKYMALYVEKQSLKVTEESVDSTNVDKVKWDSVTKDLTILFNSGDAYVYYKVPEAIYNNIVDGQAGTRTSGIWGEKGKYPSVGAATHQYLIEGGYKYKKIGSF